MSGEEKEELERRLGRPISERDWWNYLHSHDVPRGVDATLEAVAHFRRMYGLSKREGASACAEDQPGQEEHTVSPGEPEYLPGEGSLADMLGGSEHHTGKGEQERSRSAGEEDFPPLDIHEGIPHEYSPLEVHTFTLTGEQSADLDAMLDVLGAELQYRHLIRGDDCGVSGYIENDRGLRIRLFYPPLSRAEEEGRAELSEIGLMISIDEATTIDDVRAAWPFIKRVRQEGIRRGGLSLARAYHGLYSLLNLLLSQGEIEFYQEGASWWTRRRRWSLHRLAQVLNERIANNLSTFVLARCVAQGETWEVRGGRVMRDWHPFDTCAAAYAAAQEGLLLGVQVLSSYSAMDLLIALGFSEMEARDQIRQGIESLRQGREPFPSNGGPISRDRVRNYSRQWRERLACYGLDRKDETDEAGAV